MRPSVARAGVLVGFFMKLTRCWQVKGPAGKAATFTAAGFYADFWFPEYPSSNMP
jgi:hypothetical protein